MIAYGRRPKWNQRESAYVSRQRTWRTLPEPSSQTIIVPICIRYINQLIVPIRLLSRPYRPTDRRALCSTTITTRRSHHTATWIWQLSRLYACDPSTNRSCQYTYNLPPTNRLCRYAYNPNYYHANMPMTQTQLGKALLPRM